MIKDLPQERQYESIS